jgi:hypothetical protein
VCGVAAIRSFAGKLAPALEWSITATIINFVVIVYAIFYNHARTPDQTTIALLALLVPLVGQALLLIWLGWRLAKHGLTKVEVRSIIAVIPILAVFGAWNSYVFEPHTGRPIVEVSTQLSDPQTVYDPQGSPQHVVIRGTVTLHNAGRHDAGITTSLYTVTAQGLEAERDPPDALAAERQLQDALNSSDVLEIDGSNLSRLDRIVPTSDKRISLLALDQILPTYSFLAPDETWASTFALRIPVQRLASVARLTLRAEMFAVSTVPETLGNCGDDAPEALQFAPYDVDNDTDTDYYYACVAFPLKARTVFASIFGDDPDLQYYYYIGHPEIPDSPSVAIRQLVSFGAEATSDDEYAGHVRLADKYIPGSSNASATELEVVRPSQTER